MMPLLRKSNESRRGERDLNAQGHLMLKNSSPFKQDLIIGFRFKKYLTPVVLLGIILLLGTALRFYDLGAESYWMDEMFSVVEGQQSIWY